MNRAACTLCLIVAAVSWSTIALGEVRTVGEEVVAVVVPAAQASLAQWLEAELLSTGQFRPVLVLRPETPAAGEGVEAIAGEVQASIVLVASTDEQSVAAWVLEASSQQLSLFETIESRQGGPAVLAIRCAEALRAMLLEVEVARPPPPVEAELPEPEVARLTPPVEAELPEPPLASQRLRAGWSHRRLELGLGAGVLWSPGGALPAAALRVEVTYVPLRWLGLRIWGSLPPQAMAVSGPEGQAEVWAGLVALEVSARWVSPERRVGGEVGLAYALVLLDMRGEAQPPYQSLEDRVVTGAPCLRARLTVRLTAWLRFDIGAMVGVAAPRLVVAFAGRPAATWGRPLIATHLGLSALIF